MILLQALVVGSVGYALGMGIAAAFFEITLHHLPTRGIVLLWQAVLGTGITVLAIIALTSLLSLRRVLIFEPQSCSEGSAMEMYEIAVRCRGIHKDFGDGDARIEVLRGPRRDRRDPRQPHHGLRRSHRVHGGWLYRARRGASQRPRDVRPQLLSSLGGAL